MCQALIRYTITTILVCFLLLSFSATVLPQSRPDAQASPTPPASQSSSSLEHRILKNILRDQAAIWTAPFSTRRSDVKWIAPLAVSSTILFATDRRSAGELREGNHSTRLRLSVDVSRGGAFYTTSAIAGTFYVIGRTTNNERARETGLLSAEALLDTGIVITVLKNASQRPRPEVDDASGEFWDKGSSFPSGHAAGIWSVATVIAHEYGRRRPLVQLAAYGFATAVSVSRYTGQNHFLSDVLVGSAIGYGIGRYVYRTNHDQSLDNHAGTESGSGSHSRLIPLTSPIYSRSARAYGLAMSWRF